MQVANDEQRSKRIKWTRQTKSKRQIHTQYKQATKIDSYSEFTFEWISFYVYYISCVWMHVYCIHAFTHWVCLLGFHTNTKNTIEINLQNSTRLKFCGAHRKHYEINALTECAKSILSIISIDCCIVIPSYPLIWFTLLLFLAHLYIFIAFSSSCITFLRLASITVRAATTQYLTIVAIIIISAANEFLFIFTRFQRIIYHFPFDLVVFRFVFFFFVRFVRSRSVSIQLTQS